MSDSQLADEGRVGVLGGVGGRWHTSSARTSHRVTPYRACHALPTRHHPIIYYLTTYCPLLTTYRVLPNCLLPPARSVTATVAPLAA